MIKVQIYSALDNNGNIVKGVLAYKDDDYYIISIFNRWDPDTKCYSDIFIEHIVDYQTIKIENEVL